MLVPGALLSLVASTALAFILAGTTEAAEGGGLNPASGAAPALSRADRAAIVDDLVERLRADPDILVETLLRFRRADREDGGLGITPADAPASGTAQAAATVVEFVDYACEPCRAAGLVLDGLAASGEIRVVHRDLPLSAESRELAAAALEAHKGAGRYGEFRTAFLTGRAAPAPVHAEGRSFALATMRRARADAARIGVKALPALAVVRDGRMEVLVGEITAQGVRDAVRRLGGEG
ncbi:hypothetical protein BHAOGJBA_5139 [Methylobacterium hispanicum]|uniref:DSBA oxidoreductase n=1 Tax=Methylobacterium hispanicum TaxID=270350 RepID=A0AAV4ZTZ8_9HYPH|nr:thioredoxin domain-containing protein [Methylobacterium hispanicum]GJD91591.1 hypothetical protein BHAOGJBA_5139 [Methylobacterium hispanicum]